MYSHPYSRCGHCQKLAPTIARVAARVQDTMRVAAIDCTAGAGGKELCGSQAIDGYPTLKFSLDGEIQPYPFGRSERELVKFATKMASPAVTSIPSVGAADDTVRAEKLVFVAYDPSVPVPGDLAPRLQHNAFSKKYAKAARKLQAFAPFLWLDIAEEGLHPGRALGVNIEEGPFVCRMEYDYPTRCYNAAIHGNDLVAWMELENVPSISTFTPKTMSKLGKNKNLVIAAVRTTDSNEMNTITALFKEAVTKGAFREDYYFGTLNGPRHGEYLKQFGVTTTPSLFVYNYREKLVHYDADYKIDLTRLLTDVASGTLEGRKPRRQGVWYVWDYLSDMIGENPVYMGMLIMTTIYMCMRQVAFWSVSEEVEEKEKKE